MSLVETPVEPAQSSPSYAPPRRPSPSKGSYIVALLQYCNPLVKKCADCSGEFEVGGNLPHPPSDMVVVTN